MIGILLIFIIDGVVCVTEIRLSFLGLYTKWTKAPECGRAQVKQWATVYLLSSTSGHLARSVLYQIKVLDSEHLIYGCDSRDSLIVKGLNVRGEKGVMKTGKRCSWLNFHQPYSSPCQTRRPEPSSEPRTLGDSQRGRVFLDQTLKWGQLRFLGLTISRDALEETVNRSWIEWCSKSTIQLLELLPIEIIFLL